MQLDTLMRRFTIRFRMISAIVVVVMALGTVGAIGVAAQLYANNVSTGLLAQEASALTEVARLQQLLRQQNPNDTTLNSLTTLVSDMQRATGDKQKTQQTAVDQVITLMTAASLLWLAIIVPLTLLNMRSICRPVERAEQFAQAIAQGDLTDHRIDTEGHDETARLLRSLVAMQHSLASLVGQVRESSDSMSTASAEIAAGNQDLSLRTEQTASNLQQAASSLHQLTSTVRQTAESSRQANQLGSSAGEVAARGGVVVSQVVSTMGDIHVRSTKIIDIISVIDGIAFQTNILALNAAVEAARAGEQGRGFAVVASEVRSLAGRSAEAAKEIKNLIGASVERIETGSHLVAAAGQTMTDIEHSVQRVTDIISEITAAAAEQSLGLGEVNAAVLQLDQMTQQNAALVEQSAAAAESLREQAQRLAQVVDTFKLNPTPTTRSAPYAVRHARTHQPALPA